jgi:hypothetical protein
MYISGCHVLAQTSGQVPTCLHDLKLHGFYIDVMSREFPLNFVSLEKLQVLLV